MQVESLTVRNLDHKPILVSCLNYTKQMRKKLKIFRYEASYNSFEDCAKLLENLWNQHVVRYSISTQLKDAKSVSPNGALAVENHRPSISSLSKKLKTLKDSEDQMVLDEIKSIQL